MFSMELLYRLYSIRSGRLRAVIRSLAKRFDHGEFLSLTLRKIFEDYHQVRIGLYTMGGCFEPFQIDRFTTIGRYCSFARSLRTINRNHPLEFRSTHALFCVASFGYCEKDLVYHTPLRIGNDVWIGHNAIILPHVTEVGDGAVIAAGAVVNKNIPAYGVVVGNPARLIRYRFSKETIANLQASKWWEKSLEELEKEISIFQKPLQDPSTLRVSE